MLHLPFAIPTYFNLSAKTCLNMCFPSYSLCPKLFSVFSISHACTWHIAIKWLFLLCWQREESTSSMRMSSHALMKTCMSSGRSSWNRMRHSCNWSNEGFLGPQRRRDSKRWAPWFWCTVEHTSMCLTPLLCSHIIPVCKCDELCR